MTHHSHSHQAHMQGSTASYVFGFLASIVLTVVPYLIVTGNVFTGAPLVAAVVVCAVAQFVVQMVCFLHLSPRIHGRWNAISFMIIAVIIFILVIGTLWIMNHLAANMTPAEVDVYLHKQN